MLFKNLRVLFGHEVWECDVETEGGIIRRIHRHIPGRGCDLEGRFVIFNTADMHTHMRDWEQKGKETVTSGTMAALAGGMTTIVDMPNTNPPVHDAESYEKRRALFARESFCNFRINVGATNSKALSAVFDKYNPPFVKIYLTHTTGDHLFCGNLESLFAKKRPVALHGGLEHMRKCVSLSKKHETALHICHVASKGEIEFLAKKKSERMTLEVTPHHLLLETMNDVRPPVCSGEDRRALWAHMKDIDVIASDHAPHTWEDKENGAFGFSGTEIMLPLMLDCARRKMLTLFDVAQKISENPARILQTKVFEVGTEASFAVLDTKREWRIDASKFFSRGKNTPFDGRRICGAVFKTYLRGEEVFDGENVVRCSLQKRK